MPRKKTGPALPARGNCGACYHWQRLEVAGDHQIDVGECRRYPPTPLYDVSENGILSVYPETQESEVCGEFRPLQ